MDNHESLCMLDAVMYAKDNGVVIVTFPPHCSHWLQPLNVGVLGPFKSKLRVAQNDWMVSNPGKTINNHNLATLANTAYAASFTIKNITAAFKKSGVWPFDRQVFTDEDFAASSIHYVPVPATQQAPFLPENSTTKKPTKHEQNECCSNILYTSETRQRSTESVYRSSYPWRCKAVPKGSNSNKGGWAKMKDVSSIDRNARKKSNWGRNSHAIGKEKTETDP